MADVLVLCYHAVSDDWPADLATPAEMLREQLRALVRRGFHGSTFSPAVRREPNARTVAITFDDAYLSVLERAKPILDEFEMPGTVFVPTAYIAAPEPMSWPGIDHWVGGRWEEELRPLSWAQLRSLADAGWEIGSHTRTHPHLTQLGEEAVAEELEGSRAEIERELGACESIAYPYGDHDRRIVEAARAAGYATGCTLPARLHPPEPLRWPRIGIYRGDGAARFRAKVSPLVRSVRASGAWGAVERARRSGA